MMYLPSVQPISHQDIYINGDVSIDPQAIIAPGVILQAAPNSRIVIKAGACLGMGTVLNAYQGNIEIDSGAVLGPGVLIIGNCHIGSNACIGTASTVLDTKIESQSMIPPGSLIGDRSRHQGEDSPTLETELPATENPPEHTEIVEETLEEIAVESEPKIDSPTKDSPVIGEVYINQLLLTLFPESKNLGNSQK